VVEEVGRNRQSNPSGGSPVAMVFSPLTGESMGSLFGFPAFAIPGLR
jgi:hypothetical protein